VRDIFAPQTPRPKFHHRDDHAFVGLTRRHPSTTFTCTIIISLKRGVVLLTDKSEKNG
jgi:hypothetical protein